MENQLFSGVPKYSNTTIYMYLLLKTSFVPFEFASEMTYFNITNNDIQSSLNVKGRGYTFDYILLLSGSSILLTVLKKRRSNKDNLGIISHISPLKHIL